MNDEHVNNVTPKQETKLKLQQETVSVYNFICAF